MIDITRTQNASNVELGPRAINPYPKTWWQEFLKSDSKIEYSGAQVTIVDLFSSVGGLSLGAGIALGQAGYKPEVHGALDLDQDALEVFAKNLGAAATIVDDIDNHIDYHVVGQGASAQFQYSPEVLSASLRELIGNTDVVLAGPPCQGHSNLNNHTRRDDPRNRLYLAAIATAVALKPKVIVVENVPEVRRSVAAVVQSAATLLVEADYHVSSYILDASELGAPQKRRRHFTIATKWEHLRLSEARMRFAQEPTELWDVISDLEFEVGTGVMTKPAETTEVNRKRIDFLFDSNLWNLPDNQRPNCHKNGHTYPSVYGRMFVDRPAQTITGGFMSPGRGRFIHPTQRRVITPHEAARIQGFPDWFSFELERSEPTRKQLAKWIGDAVPSYLGYYAILAALTPDDSTRTIPFLGQQK